MSDILQKLQTEYVRGVITVMSEPVQLMCTCSSCGFIFIFFKNNIHEDVVLKIPVIYQNVNSIKS